MENNKKKWVSGYGGGWTNGGSKFGLGEKKKGSVQVVPKVWLVTTLNFSLKTVRDYATPTGPMTGSLIHGLEHHVKVLTPRNKEEMPKKMSEEEIGSCSFRCP